MANPWGSYIGFGNIPGSTNYGSQATRDYMSIWNNAWNAFLAPYLQRFGGTPFAQQLRSRESDIRGMFDAENARRLAQGGDLLGQMRPDDWLLGFPSTGSGGPPNDRGPGAQPGAAPGGLQGPRAGFDPLSWYMGKSPEARGEGRMPNPFTRWLSF